ncbi:MAG: aspartate--tRNA ligase [Chloroflexi bacterium]|nr:aspartate--tRNA ligase [Chloroflexota bacterium]
MLKTENCGELGLDQVGRSVRLAGWVHRRRDHGGVIFLDLRDRSGLVQVVLRSETAAEAYAAADEVRNEYVLEIQGNVLARESQTVNPNMPTGEIEVVATRLVVLNPAKPLPIQVNEDDEVDELIRLKYRYIDLRRDAMRRSLELRHRMNHYIRNFMTERDFWEIETPQLTAATPEGARDYVVPSRLHHGTFYALPQAPQQFKQLLMVAGIERYFQIARCFRDEDLRADRQPEFTQLDVEWSFVDEEDILGLMEELFNGLTRELRPDMTTPSPWSRIPYAEALERFGTDQPDLRFGLELSDCSDLVKDSGFGVFAGAVEAGGRVRGVVMPTGAELSRKEVDRFTDLAKTLGAKGLVSIQFSADPSTATEDDVRSPVLRHLGLETANAIGQRCGAASGDLVLLAADADSVVNTTLDGIRREIARRLELADPLALHYAFITEFPLVEWNSDEDRWDAMHHPFTAPFEADMDKLESDPGAVRARAYDIVANGYELASGSIRIHQRDMQERVFRLLGMDEAEAQERFGHMLEAFEYGAPPHGGIAPGLDRVAMLLAGRSNIREVIAFPKTQAATDPMTGAPSPIPQEQLDELAIITRVDETPSEDAVDGA